MNYIQYSINFDEYALLGFQKDILLDKFFEYLFEVYNIKFTEELLTDRIYYKEIISPLHLLKQAIYLYSNPAYLLAAYYNNGYYIFLNNCGRKMFSKYKNKEYDIYEIPFELESILEYLSHPSKLVSNTYRKKLYDIFVLNMDDYNIEKCERIYNILQGAILNAPKNESPMVLFRAQHNMEPWSNYIIGEKFITRNFMSTSYLEIQETFGNNYIIFFLPKNIPHLHVNSEENEILLPAGLEMQVIKREKNKLYLKVIRYVSNNDSISRIDKVGENLYISPTFLKYYTNNESNILNKNLDEFITDIDSFIKDKGIDHSILKRNQYILRIHRLNKVEKSNLFLETITDKKYEPNFTKEWEEWEELNNQYNLDNISLKTIKKLYEKWNMDYYSKIQKVEDSEVENSEVENSEVEDSEVEDNKVEDKVEDSKFLNDAISNGNLEKVKMLLNKGYKCDKNSFEISVLKNYPIEFLDFLIQQNCPISDDILIYAGMGGNIEVLEWVKNNIDGIKCDENVLIETASNRHFEALKWLYNEMNCPLSEELFTQVAYSNNIEMIEWLFEEKCPVNESVYYSTTDINILNMFKNKNVPRSENVFIEIIIIIFDVVNKEKRVEVIFEVINWLIKNNFPYNKQKILKEIDIQYKNAMNTYKGKDKMETYIIKVKDRLIKIINKLN